MQHQVTNILHSHFLKDPIRWCNKKSVIFWQNLPPCQFRCWYYTIPAKTIRRITSACPSNSTEWRNSILYQHFKKLHLSMGLALCLRGDLYLFSINTTLYITVNMQMLLGIEICSICWPTVSLPTTEMISRPLRWSHRITGSRQWTTPADLAEHRLRRVEHLTVSPSTR